MLVLQISLVTLAMVLVTLAMVLVLVESPESASPSQWFRYDDAGADDVTGFRGDPVGPDAEDGL